MVTRSVPARVVVPLAAAALLAGCGGADTPPASTPSTSTTSSPSPASASSTPSASSAKPTAAPSTATPTARIPTAAKAHSKAGAEAFVRAYFAAFNRAWTTPTTTELVSYGSPSCKSCTASLETARRLVTESQRYDGPPVTVTALAATTDGSGSYRVAVHLRQEERHVVDGGGKIVLTDSRKVGQFEVALAWTESRWLIKTIRRSA